jgi:hypothetical protein
MLLSVCIACTGRNLHNFIYEWYVDIGIIYISLNYKTQFCSRARYEDTNESATYDISH